MTKSTQTHAGVVALGAWGRWCARVGWLVWLAGLGDGPIDPSPKVMNNTHTNIYIYIYRASLFITYGDKQGTPSPGPTD
jgi:hypothetical protein